MIAHDQLESQTAAQLARYMFNIPECDAAMVDAGEVWFQVRTKSSFAF